MHFSYELDVVNLKRNISAQPETYQLYVPLQGKHTTNLGEEPFDLAEKIKEFFVFDDLNASDPRVMLLMGDAGSGKSVFAQQTFQHLWRVRKDNDPIPLWIPLPELLNPFEDGVEEVLKKYEFTESQIAEMKAKERFIFIVDGYDELHHFQNCYVTNGWEKWNAKVLMTCRSQALYYQKDPDKYFVPFHGEKRLTMLLRKLYIAPFSKEQISAYVEKYRALNTENMISEEDFAKVPGLIDLINTPFLLHIAAETLPDILAAQCDDQKMTQAKLYDVFIERWFTRQVKKLRVAGLLKDTEQNTKQQFWDYCKKLALQMHEKQASVIPYQFQKVGGRLFGKQEKTNIWDNFFNEATEVLRSACPLKRVGDNHYGFVHASMVEYFATRAMYEEVHENKFNTPNSPIASEKRKSNEMIGISGSLRVARDDEEGLLVNSGYVSPRVNNQPRGGIHQRLFSEEKNTIRFLADRIEMCESFKQKMLMILESSKKNGLFAVGAANAITALVKAGVTFNRKNLQGIKISGADISGGYFDQADLSHADLRVAQMRNVWLREANLEGSQIEGINLGEYPWFKQDNNVLCFDYRDDLQSAISGSAQNVILWNTLTGEQLITFRGHSGVVTCVQYSSNGQCLVSGSSDKTIRIWEISTSKEMAVLHGHEDVVNSVSFSPQGEAVVSGSKDKTVRIWDVVKAELKYKLIGHRKSVTSVQFSHDGKWIASGSADSTIRIWAVEKGDMIAVLSKNDMDLGVQSVCFSMDGSRVVSGCGNNTVRVWDIVSQALIAELHGHERSVHRVAFSPEGDRVVSGTYDKTVRVWDISNQKVLFVLRGHEDFVEDVQFNYDGKQVISGSKDNTLRIWDVGSEKFLARARGHAKYISNIHFSHDGRLMASGSTDSTVRIWEVASGKECVVIRGHDDVLSAQFSPDGKWVASGSEGSYFRLWEVESGKKVGEFEVNNMCVESVSFSSNSERMVLGSSDYEGNNASIHLWEVRSGKELMVLKGHKGRVMSVAFSHDDKRVFSGSYDNTLRIWEVSSQKELAQWHCEDIGRGVCFNSHENLAAYCGKGNVRIIDMENGKTIFVMTVSNYEASIQFTGDRQHIIIGSEKTVQIWNIANQQCTIIWKFHDKVTALSYHHSGTLVVGFDDHSIACLQNTGAKNNDHLELCWTTNIDSPNLFVEGLRASHMIGLSEQNRRVLEQRGARLDAKAKSDTPPLTTLIVQRATSPIHQRPVLAPLQQVQSVDVVCAEDQELREQPDQKIIHQNRGEFDEGNNREDGTKSERCCVII